MAEILVKNRICQACGAEVRSGALFCYNCGGAVAAKSEERGNGKKENTGEILFCENVESNGNQTDDSLQDLKIEKKTAEKAAERKELPLAAIAEKPVQKTTIDEPVRLKSAASLRKKSKILPQKKIEIVWEENENAPNGWFVLFALILAIFAVSLVYLAMYFR